MSWLLRVSDDVATRHAHFNSLELWVSRLSHVKTFLATTRKGGCLSTVAVSAIERNQSTFLAKENACGWGEVGVEEWALKLQRGVTAGSERVLLEERHKQMTGEVWSSGSLRRINFTFPKYRHYKLFIFNLLEQPAHLSLFSFSHSLKHSTCQPGKVGEPAPAQDGGLHLVQGAGGAKGSPVQDQPAAGGPGLQSHHGQAEDQSHAG